MQQNECRDQQLLLMEPVLEPGRSFSVVQTHAALRSKLLPTSVVLHWEGGCTGLVVLELLHSSDVPLVQSKNEFLEEEK